MLPPQTNIREAYSVGRDQEQNFIQNLAMFLCTFLKDHGTLVEKKEFSNILLTVSVKLIHIESMLIKAYLHLSL